MGVLFAVRTEKLKQWCRVRLSFRNATILIKHIKESEEIRRAMEPTELIKRVREIEREANTETEPIQQKDTKQTAAVDLMSRLNNIHVNTDADSMKALEEWRKRKMERAKQRGLGKNATISGQNLPL